MTSTLLSTISVEKPWGRHSLGFGFGDVPGDSPAIGEIWFDAPPGEQHDLMVKYLFTSERLSIQVHPNDAQAHAKGLRCGKEEAWFILDAAPEATIAIGLTHSLSKEALRSAMLDGSIEALMDWKPVRAGDVIYLPAGTIHAIGAGISLIEVQQNIDLTYRLYDYGRPRPLHLDEGIAVSRPEPFTVQDSSTVLGEGRIALVTGGKFVVERWTWSGNAAISLPTGVDAWLIPVEGAGQIDGHPLDAGQCWHVTGHAPLSLNTGSNMLFTYAGPTPLPILLVG